MARDWTPSSWRQAEARQQPDYPDGEALAAALREIAAYPPLVPAEEAHALRDALAEAQAGRAFLLQGGDCAESFAGFSPEAIRGTFALMEKMAARLADAAGVPVIRVGRIAGQFAKPRTRIAETREGVTLPMYRGDIVNCFAFDAEARRPDPQRLFHAYAQSAATLSHLRPLAAAAGTPFYASHEALLLGYEQALVRRDGAGWYGGSAHLLWIGDRTRFPGSAHIELLRGLANPIAVKCGPGLEPDTLLHLLDALNPARRPGRITLIARLGADRVANRLPPLVRAAAGADHPVLWCCDPMHGNTERAAGGHKTRRLERIVAEAAGFFAAVRAEGAVPGGLHVEMTARDVTECVGGTVSEADIPARYESLCDPRLGPAQALALAEAAAQALRAARPARAA
ncbi:MAG: 3-deoxy-7-phosphoheptulonate synthase [Allosphingosinicella sp.]